MNHLTALNKLQTSSTLSLRCTLTFTFISSHSRVQVSTRNPVCPLGCTSFHQSTSRQLYNDALQIIHHVFQSIHSISGTPWSVTIPLIVLLTRVSTSLPLAIIQQRAIKQQVELAPILMAWKHAFRKQIIRQVGDQGPKVCQKHLYFNMQRKRKELFKRYKCGRWKIYIGFTQIPVFLSVFDLLRRMADLELNSIFKSFGMEKLIGDHVVIPFEPNLANEGLLWFPNLLLSDPHLILPFTLSGIMLLNIFVSGKPLHSLSKGQIRIRRMLGVIALFVGPLFLQLPCVLLLYWNSHYFLSWIQGWIVAWAIPIPRPIQPLVPRKPWRIVVVDEKETDEKNTEL